MEVIEQRSAPVKKPLANALDVIWHPHPVSPSAGRQMLLCPVLDGHTVRDVLIHSGIDLYQPIVISLDDRLLTVEEWDLICPKPGQIINVQATVMGGGGGGGGSNPVQMVAMIALVVVVSYFTFGTGTMTAASLGLSAFQTAVAGGLMMMAGSMILNAIFQAGTAATDTNNGQYAQASPTYSLSGGSNRSRPYESMPVVMGTMQFFPDLAARPFTEYHGEDQYLYQVFHFGLSNAILSNYKIGTTALENYQEYSWSHPDSLGKINSFPGNVDTIAGADLVQSASWITRTTSSSTYRIGIDIEGTLYYANNGGGLDNTSVQIRIQYRPVGTSTWINPSVVTTQGAGFVSGVNENYDVWVESGYWETQYSGWDDWWWFGWGTDVWVDTSHWETRSRFKVGSNNIITISGASQSPRRATLFIDVTPGTYEVRVIRDTGDSTNARLQNKTNWSVLRSYQQDTSSYVGQNRKGLIIRASEQLNGAIQQLSAQASALAYYWNGSAWVSGYTSNPAHWYMDFAYGRRGSSGKLLYGVGLPASQIDLAALHSWATFCANEGLTFNAVLDGAQTASDILTAIARCGFASPSWSSGKIGVVWDARNASPVAAFGMSNIIKGSFQISYITEQLAEEIIVRYVNPNKDWQQDEVRVTVPGVTTPTRTSSIDLLGCTNTAMAGKFANYLAAQQYYRKRRITWDSDFEGFVCQRGDVVLLSHDLTQWGYSGRLVGLAGDTLTLDRQVPRNGAIEYVMLKKPNGTMTTYTAVAGTGDSDSLTLTSTPTLQSGYELMDHMWFFSPLATPGKKVKILSVQPISESRVTVTATDEDPQFYAAWDGTWQEPTNKTLLLDSIPVISNVKFIETLYKKSAGIFSQIAISFDVKGSYDHTNLRWRINGGYWKKGISFSSSFEFETDEIGLLEVELLPVGLIRSGSTLTASTQIYGVSLPPDNVVEFTIANNNVAWTPVSNIDVTGYEVRWNSANELDWSSAQPLHAGLLTSSPWNLPYTISGGVLLIKAVDIVGNRSLSPAYIRLPETTITPTNVFESKIFDSIGWPGVITGGTMTPGGIIADSLDPDFWQSDKEEFWHGDTDQFWNYGYSEISYICQYVPTTLNRAINLTLKSDIVGNGSVEYRRIGANNPWMYWPGSIVAETGGYEFRVTVSGGKEQGRINAFSVSASTNTTTLYFNDLVISNTGTRLPIGAGWYGILGIKLTVQSDGNGASTALTIDKSLSGPLIKCYNNLGNQVQGLIDAEIRLY